MCDGTHTQDSVYTDWHQDKFSFRRRYNLKKPDWPKYENHIDKCIAKITPTPETYEKFVNLVRRVSQKNIPRACRTSYVCGLNDHTKEMYEDYQRRFTEDLFSKDKVIFGDALLNNNNNNNNLYSHK